jgi:hypothetical protein
MLVCNGEHLVDEKLCSFFLQDVGSWLEEINLGGYRQIFKENGVNGEYLESMSVFTTESKSGSRRIRVSMERGKSVFSYHRMLDSVR